MGIEIKDIEKIDNNALPYAHWLYNIQGVGRNTIIHMLAHAETPEAIYRLPKEKIESILPTVRRKPGLAESIDASRHDFDIRAAYHKLEEKHIRFTCIGHADYPHRLLNIPDAPYGIYYRGRLPESSRPAVATIGARNCSEYGRRMAQHFGSELAMMGVQVISGMARGIDGIGQKAALESGGYSLGVLGCGVDICYPEENRYLYDMLCRQGGVCSEYPPGTLPKNSLFPLRNRIISGLSDIVLVIEAKNRSGTLITVDMALEQGKEVYALPGRVTDALSEGCNHLLQQGAGIALSPQDMIKVLMEKVCSMQRTQPPSNRKPGKNNAMETNGSHSNALETDESRSNTAETDESRSTTVGLSDIQSELMQVLEETPQSVETIKEHLLSNYNRDISLPELLNQLMKLTFCGLVKQIGNSYFAKV